MRELYYCFIGIVCLFSAPILLIISIGVFMLSGLPIFFRQKRVGKDGKVFVMYKFRTMVQGAEKKQEQLKKLNEADGPVFKIHNDPRFTPVGKFLSHTGLDELPQLINILKGDMALIGPRPLPVSEAKKLTFYQRQRHMIKPGIISPWILNGYHKKPFAEWMESDIFYARQKSISTDVDIFFRSTMYMCRLLLNECCK